MSSQPPKKGGLSLYANLLDPASESSAASGTISKAPVLFTQSSEPATDTDDTATDKQQKSAASLRFQPIKRPQLPNQKPRAKPIPKPPSTAHALGNASSAGASSTRSQVKSTLADWASTADDDDVNGFYGREKRQRGGRKKRKKNREGPETITNWDDIYDPSRPNNYEEYKRSDEKIREVREWKDRLYAHRMARRRSSDFDSDNESPPPRNRQFAPPSYNFVPPPNLNDASKPLSHGSDEDAYAQRLQKTTEDNEAEMEDVEYQPPPPPAVIPNEATGDDAYARRLQMSQQQPPPPPHEQPQVPVKPSLSAFQPASATISRAPVRYTLPPAPEDIPATEEELEAVMAKEEPVQDDGEDAPRSLRPGQKGFAERLMAKYGWTKGSGLGASGTGIVNPLQVKVEKQKKKPDSEGGGFATPAGRGKIIASKKKNEEEGKFGPMSEVIVLYGMLDGMDLATELDNSQNGGLMQEIGEECNEKYGRVERVFIHRQSNDRIPVFVKFTAQLSALRAVNALEGRMFNGNKITARFYDTEKFENGIYQ
ncbi:G-patch DNA repair protein (Drt111), putative [Talaromyces stipitatus ATCC 10500]|uniref:G-patch DNA repair protein (Drt111), putative n=1 Tax=Talaromyces stipitatus (strain ATCC 10500 / CBS 375.48 / QM 6759 / NRRL 1006) TaxID=441959 RepID=B8LUG3_TALSN|nr:G-patch DNA repair protein (Drt111), putative [Talaromyces stipitatus ATCC 10500]EED23736.1 G-patch DNA repair protein (Drt111), putative [Talaromyces stipitatus ATCC 10500]